jgi:hypothetical protein
MRVSSEREKRVWPIWKSASLATLASLTGKLT